MGANIESIDAMISATNTGGYWSHFFFGINPSTTTAATENCGGVTIQKFSNEVVVPTLGSGIASARFPGLKMLSTTADSTAFCGLQYELGSLAVSTNTFTSGVSMPSKTIASTSTTTAASLVMAVVTVSTSGGASPVLTTTYTNQDGTASRTSTMTLPNSITLLSGFALWPHLQGTDTGIRSVSNMSISSGSAGTIKIYGILPLAFGHSQVACAMMSGAPVSTPNVMWPCGAGETIAFYRIGTNQAGHVMAHMFGIGDV